MNRVTAPAGRAGRRMRTTLRHAAFAAVVASFPWLANPAASAQVQPQPVLLIAAAEPAPAPLPAAGEPSSPLPEAPGAMLMAAAAQAGNVGVLAKPHKPHKYASVIEPGEVAQPLNAGDKVKLGFANAFSLGAAAEIVASASWSQLIGSAPHYVEDPYGKRLGAAAVRGTVQTLATDSVFAPLLHDDPRYYERGDGHPFLSRALYAATRVVVTRSDSGQSRFNAPLFLGYAVAAGLNNAYYPRRDRGGKETAEDWASSVGGAVVGFEVDEFLGDALRIAHLRRR